MYHKLLIDDYPIQVLPKLAEAIGLNEAIVLQQIHYWLNKSNKYIDGRKWVYNTYEGWQKQFSFWSLSTVKRVLNNLRKQGLLLTGNYNKAGFDKTVWYTIDYDLLNRMNQRLGQNEPTSSSNWTDGVGQNDLTNTIDYTETTTETTKDIPSRSVEQDSARTNTKKKAPVKHKYGEFKNVLLTDDELKKLQDKFVDWEERIERLSSYIGSKGVKYKSHYITILNWARKDKETQAKQNIGYTRTNDDYAGTPFG